MTPLLGICCNKKLYDPKGRSPGTPCKYTSVRCIAFVNAQASSTQYGPKTSTVTENRYTDVRCMWEVAKIMVPFWIPIIMRHLIFSVPKKGPSS